jgi:glycosyltransferase involved in cell wall biosynthesis/SAM-dependent methyltransferase/uncharacterized protein YbaR (Trm112 family)
VYDRWSDASVREALACPACLGALAAGPADDRVGPYLLCGRCGGVYPIEHETPHLLDLPTLVRLPLEVLAVWHITQQRAVALYEANDPGSCSLRERDDVGAFRRFMGLAGKDVLDVGSGSFALPGYADGEGHYADGRGYALYVGVDAVPPTSAPPFPLVVALGERLPFRDASFDAVVLATSLDHAVDVDAALAEVRRVLRPGGEVYVWTMFVEAARLGGRRGVPAIGSRGGATPVAPTDPVAAHLAARAKRDEILARIDADPGRFERELVDDFHFRHFDRADLLASLARAGLWVAAEEPYRSEGGDLHTFLRVVEATPEQRTAYALAERLDDELDRVLEPVRALRSEVAAAQAALAELSARQLEAQAALATLTSTPTRRATARASRHARQAAHAVRHASRMAPSLLRARAASPRARGGGRGKRILMLAVSQLQFDPRVNKVARSLADAGYEVEIMTLAIGDRFFEEQVGAGVRYLSVPRESPFRLFLLYQDEFRRVAAGREFDYVHANDLTTLTVAWVLARSRGVPLVYDAHELWTENVEFRGAEWVPMSAPTRAIASRWESFLLRDVDLLVTVGPSIVAEFERRNGGLARPPLLLANYPSLALLDDGADAMPSIRAACGLDDGAFVTLYMGGVSRLRNIEGVIEAHRHLPDDHVFVVRGQGVEIHEPEYRALARSLGVEERVFFLPPVGRDEVVAGMAGADCGIVMLRNICKNFYLFYPNKLFEYGLAGLPVAASEFPDVAAYIRQERCGVTFDPHSPESIAAALLDLGADRDAARAMGERGRASVLERHNWEAAVQELVAAYDSLA